MSIRIILHEGESVTLNASSDDVNTETGALVVKRDGKTIGKFRRYVAWHEVEQAVSSGD